MERLAASVSHDCSREARESGQVELRYIYKCARIEKQASDSAAATASYYSQYCHSANVVHHVAMPREKSHASRYYVVQWAKIARATSLSFLVQGF